MPSLGLSAVVSSAGTTVILGQADPTPQVPCRPVASDSRVRGTTEIKTLHGIALIDRGKRTEKETKDG